MQQNIVRNDGRRSVLLSVLKNGNASTVRSSRASARSLISRARRHLLLAASPRAVRSIARHCIDRRRAPRGSDRGRPHRADDPAVSLLLAVNLIVLISIPLSILTSIIIPLFHVHTLNTMTLGGMALAVGILVDDLTVTIENTHRLRSEGRPGGGDPARLRRHCRVDDGLDACDQLRVHLGGSSLKGLQNFCSPCSLAVGTAGMFRVLPRALADTMCRSVIGFRLLKGEHHGDDGPATGSAVSRADRARLLRAVPPGPFARVDDAGSGRCPSSPLSLR